MATMHRPAERYEHGNAVLDALPGADRERVIPHLTMFRAEVPDCVVAHGEEFKDVFFPVGAIFSITAQLQRGDVYEVAATGRQGVVGAELALGLQAAPRSIMSQVDGWSARMPRDAFVHCCGQSPALTNAIHQHFARRLFIAEQFIACNFAHGVTQRCARWLLMLRDEVGRDEFGLRHEFLGMMLGLAPHAVPPATSALRQVGAIRYSDEVVSILDVAALAEATCECYEAQRCFAPVAA